MKPLKSRANDSFVRALFLCLAAVFSACAQSEDIQTTPIQQPDGPIVEGAVKIEVRQDGIYRLTLEQLQTAGLSLEQLTTDQLQLSQAGRPVPYWLTHESLLFYGRAADTIYTDKRPYILRMGPAGTQMQTTAAPDHTGPLLKQVARPLWLEENNVYVSKAHEADTFEDTWFWHTIHVEQTFEVPLSLEQVADGAATLQMHLYGASHDPQIVDDHDLDIVVNSQTIDTMRWEGQVHHTGNITLPPGSLKSGENTLVLDNAIAGAAFIDIMQLDWLALTYNALPVATQDRLEFHGRDGTVTLTGFSNQPLIFDASSPDAPQLLTDWTYEDNAVTLNTTAGMHIIAVGRDGFLQPERIAGLRKSSLQASSNQADLLIVTTEALAPALTPLIEQRESQGLTVTIATVEDIYDTFGDGEESPTSLHTFLTYAHDAWAAPAPQYLFLVGDGTYDYRNYTGQRPLNHVPSFMIPVTHSGETVSDARLADVDGDLRPDMAVGRWPVDSYEAVENLVERTLAYEAGPVTNDAIFSADGTSAEFTGLSDYLLSESKLPQENVHKLYGSSFEQVANQWNNGAWLVTYVGHGSLNLWGKDSVFSSEAVTNLKETASAPPIVLQFTCLTGFFAHPTDPSISETLLTSENGPVLIVAATSLTLSSQQRPFALGLLEGLQDPNYTRMGDILQHAKEGLDVHQAGLLEISDTFGLMGDPSALVTRPGLNTN